MSDFEDPSLHRHEANATATSAIRDQQQYHALPSPLPSSAKKIRNFWWHPFIASYGSTSKSDGSHNNNDPKQPFRKQPFKQPHQGTSDTLLPTTYAVKGISSGHAGTLHQRNVVGVAGGVGGDNNVRGEDRMGEHYNRSKNKLQDPHALPSSTINAYQRASSTWNCTSFLLGGQYYPGKDKKRRALRRKTLWYRIFCSHPLRKILSWMTVTYVVFRLVSSLPGWMSGDSTSNVRVDRSSSIRNFFTWNRFFGGGDGSQHLGGNRAATILERLQFDTSLQLLSLRQEEVALHHIESERSRLQFESRQNHRNEEDEGTPGYVPLNARQKMLEHLAPEWFHRFDSTPSLGHHRHHSNKHHHEKESDNTDEIPRINKKRQRSKAFQHLDGNDGNRDTEIKQTPQHDIPANDANKSDNHGDTQDQSSQSIAQRRALVVEGGVRTSLPLRTIHNMQDVASNHSLCHVEPSHDLQREKNVTTTLITQSTISRLWILNETCHRWKQPIIATVFIPSNLTPADANMLEITETKLLNGNTCPQIEIIHYMADYNETLADNYPVNRLRNVGLDHATTSHILVMDIDFVPSKGLDQLIRKALTLRHDSMNAKSPDKKSALVVPAFERRPPFECQSEQDCAQFLQRNSSFIPQTFADLVECVKAKDCIVFQSDVSLDSHSTTRSNEWLEGKWYDGEDKATYRSISCFHTSRYEPYVVLEWCSDSKNAPASFADSAGGRIPLSPYYDERFHGYGKNKIELVTHLRKSGYRFEILPEGFIMHNPHPESSMKQVWNDRGKSDLHNLMDRLYSQFIKELDVMYAEQHKDSIKLCTN
ncbi:glycosyl-transferase [Nitzschia inconspicua]|uniref:Glycosyl-transferase n=1 Tax=Nitzschia inconspicua TaxID=303405 RepID=A0A9K3M2D4_9STRA|nr:glycosyl-transferase [Nitzschia inconspicua]